MAATFVFAALFAVSAFGQGAQTASGFKMAVINTAAFDSQEGIKRYTAAMNALENEFKPLQTEIEGLLTKWNNLGKEIQTIQANAQKASTSGATVPFDEKAAQAKVEEYQNLEIQIKRKQEDAKNRLERREPQVMGPIRREIGEALQVFAKQKGYALILDAAKLDGAGLILAFDETKVDATKEFITFFNARPASTASATTPR